MIEIFIKSGDASRGDTASLMPRGYKKKEVLEVIRHWGAEVIRESKILEEGVVLLVRACGL